MNETQRDDVIELMRKIAEKDKEIERLQAKLRRVRDWIKSAANSENGIVAEIDDTL